jgi:hypothetical protein
MAVRYFTVVAGESETEHVLEVVVVESLSEESAVHQTC